MNKCTLLIDGNWLLISRYSMMSKEFSSEFSEDILRNSQSNLVDLLAQSINKTINTFNNHIDNIILVRDFGSWRKSLPKPSSYIDIDYKGTRERQDDISWKHVYESLDLLGSKFDEYGITTTRSYEVEGDDWIWFWSSYLNENNTNSIVWSTDADLKQLVKKTDTGTWTAWFNEKNGLIYPEDNKSELDNFMMELNPHSIYLENLINDFKTRNYKVNPIQSQDIIMNKIICGDVSDNIKAIITVFNGKRTIKISEKEWFTVKEALRINNLDEFFANKNEILNRLTLLKRFVSFNISAESLDEIFEYNKKLVLLAKDSYPENILSVMESQKDNYKEFDLSLIRNNYKILSIKDIITDKSIFDDLNFDF